jgi:carbon monoxide dehydrogenase subunit G
MEFRIDANLPATAAQLWDIFFDVQRVATLIPGCEDVVEVEPLKVFSAVMKQKIGPFKLEVPTRITIESHTMQRQVVLVAAGSDKFTGTTIDVKMQVDLQEQREGDDVQCRLAIDASMQVAGRLASLGYPIVKKRSEELFGEFQRRLRLELSGFEPGSKPVASSTPAPAAAGKREPSPLPTRQPNVQETRASAPTARQLDPLAAQVPASRRMQLVLGWPRVGVSVGVAVAIAHGAVAFGQSPWWWLAAPLLGVLAGLEKRGT